MNSSLEEAYDRILTVELDVIVAENPSMRVSVPSLANTWNIPAGDRNALGRWGLPVMSRNPKSVHFKPDPQGSIDPEISWPDGLAYRLGSYHYREIGASVGDGVVIGVPQERLHPYPFLWLNGSVTSFIQISWRWSLAMPIFSLLEQAGEMEQLVDNLYRFPEYASSKDSRIGRDEKFHWWSNIAGNW
jgi:SUKH-4 immunity protein